MRTPPASMLLLAFLSAAPAGGEPASAPPSPPDVRSRDFSGKSDGPWVSPRRDAPTDAPPTERIDAESEAALREKLLPLLRGAMDLRGYQPADAEALASTMAKVMVVQLAGNYDQAAALAATMGGRLRAESYPEANRQRALQQQRGLWESAESPSRVTRLQWSLASVRAYDRTGKVEPDTLPTGKAQLIKLSQVDWGHDFAKHTGKPSDMVALRVPVVDASGVEGEAIFSYARLPNSDRWVPILTQVIHNQRTPPPSVNFL
ncbi:MAG: hypothetical protein J0L61_05480 [Planctomycetes bacterium]|nr:hypothetical protein [Planctomycetota bacterium]